MLQDLGITKGEVVRYTLLPQIFPRIQKLFKSGLGDLPYFVAALFNTTGIIPNGHPCLKTGTHRRYSLLQVLGIAANNITFDRKNIDKITVFSLVLTGIVMMVLQLILFVLAMLALPAYAAGSMPTTGSGFFKNETPEKDIAFRMLDLIFGLPGIFNSADAKTTPFHTGLHALFELYSYGILLVGVFILIYLTIRVVLETAESGIPFGQRFNKAWAPIRIVLFFGLLLPTSTGINLAQHLALSAAKMGSNLATNAWLTFDKTMQEPYLGRPDQLIATPNVPDFNSFIGFMTVARTCSVAEGRINGNDIKPYMITGTGANDSTQDMSTNTPAFTDTVKAANGGTISIRFGKKDTKAFSSYEGGVYPYCGELTLPILDQHQPGSIILQQAYIEMINCMWSGRTDGSSGKGAGGTTGAATSGGGTGSTTGGGTTGSSTSGSTGNGQGNNPSGNAYTCNITGFEQLGKDFTNKYAKQSSQESYPSLDAHIGDSQKAEILNKIGASFKETLDKAVKEQVSKSDWNNKESLPYGWAGAGIWFNKIAEQNGAMTSAVMAIPQIRHMPSTMEEVRKAKEGRNATIPIAETYVPFMPNGDRITMAPQDLEIVMVLNKVVTYWGSENSIAWYKDKVETHNPESTGNIIIDTINVMMGTRGLFDMCKNTNVHPLAKLSSLGRGMVEHSIRGFAVAAGVGVSGGIMSILNQQQLAGVLKSATSFFVTFASIGLAMGFILFYVLPFLPFIYFFFAVATWVKSIFEAMVGLPLWALAHLRIDGEGMPGDVAESGYFHILEIFLRPICILIGFLGGLLIFAAMVKVLNETFYLALSNLSGHNIDNNTGSCFSRAPDGAVTGSETGTNLTESNFKRSVIDEFFYTVMYTIIVYMSALPCFKLCDAVPDHIMRWLGANISSFGSQDGDPAADVMTHVSAGAGTVGSNLSRGFGMGD